MTEGRLGAIVFCAAWLGGGVVARIAWQFDRTFVDRCIIIGGFSAWTMVLLLIYTLRFPAPADEKDHCIHCGYDMRATPGRCPECGDKPNYARIDVVEKWWE